MDEWCIISKSIQVLLSVILHPTNTSITHFLNMCTRRWHLSIFQQNISGLHLWCERAYSWITVSLVQCTITDWAAGFESSRDAFHYTATMKEDIWTLIFTKIFRRIPLIVQKTPTVRSSAPAFLLLQYDSAHLRLLSPTLECFVGQVNRPLKVKRGSLTVSSLSETLWSSLQKKKSMKGSGHFSHNTEFKQQKEVSCREQQQKHDKQKVFIQWSEKNSVLFCYAAWLWNINNTLLYDSQKLSPKQKCNYLYSENASTQYQLQYTMLQYHVT